MLGDRTHREINDIVGELRSLTSSTTNNNVGAKHLGDQFCHRPKFLYPNASPCGGLSRRAKLSETNIQNYPIDSRPNASPLQIINPHQFANNIF
ncbi:MAG: hypothetical protein AB1589_18825 [Cyanobacteriota bacterium]